MRNETTKGDFELDVFRKFVKASGLAIDLASAKKCVPPEPDLICSLEGEGSIRFELVEICDENLAPIAADPMRGENAYIRTSDPSRAVVERKLRKKYPVTEPIELLCHMEHRVATPDSTAVPTLQKLFSESTFQFRRVWLHGRKGVYQLWPAV